MKHPDGWSSNLPKLRVEPSSDFPAWLKVYCPRDDCPSYTSNEQLPFLVQGRVWKRPRKGRNGVIIYGRVCPYCHRSARL